MTVKDYSRCIVKGVGFMARINGWDSSSISTLFSSLHSSGRMKTSSPMFSSVDISTYSSIKSGSYYKLVKSYYAQGLDEKASSLISPSISTSADSAKTLGNIQAAAGELTDSAKALYKNAGAVFKKDSGGAYNTDDILKKVSQFVDDYNELVSSASKSETSKITNTLDSLESLTNSNTKTLEKIGISVSTSSGKLSMDEDTFKNADMNVVKSLFGGTGSYGYGVAVKASMIESNARLEASKSNTYSSKGGYNSTYNSGYVYNKTT